MDGDDASSATHSECTNKKTITLRPQTEVGRGSIAVKPRLVSAAAAATASAALLEQNKTMVSQ